MPQIEDVSDRSPLLMTPGPTEVGQRVLDALSRRPMLHYGDTWKSFYVSTLELIRQFFNSEADDQIILVPAPGSACLEMAITNLAKPGDKILNSEKRVFWRNNKRMCTESRHKGNRTKHGVWKTGFCARSEETAGRIRRNQCDCNGAQRDLNWCRKPGSGNWRGYPVDTEYHWLWILFRLLAPSRLRCGTGIAPSALGTRAKRYPASPG